GSAEAAFAYERLADVSLLRAVARSGRITRVASNDDSSLLARWRGPQSEPGSRCIARIADDLDWSSRLVGPGGLLFEPGPGRISRIPADGRRLEREPRRRRVAGVADRGDPSPCGRAQECQG